MGKLSKNKASGSQDNGSGEENDPPKRRGRSRSKHEETGQPEAGVSTDAGSKIPVKSPKNLKITVENDRKVNEESSSNSADESSMTPKRQVRRKFVSERDLSGSTRSRSISPDGQDMNVTGSQADTEGLISGKENKINTQRKDQHEHEIIIENDPVKRLMYVKLSKKQKI